MIGYFINPLALRVDVSGDPTFRELLAARARDDARRVRARRRPLRDGRARDLARTRLEPDARLPGDDGAAQPGVGAQAAEVRAGRRHRDRARAREGLGEVRPPARNEPAAGRAQHDLGVQHRALRRRRPRSGSARTSRSCSSRSPQIPTAGLAAADAPRRGALGDPLRLVEGARPSSRRSGSSRTCSRRARRHVPDADAVVFEGDAAHVPRARRAREPARAPPARVSASVRAGASAIYMGKSLDLVRRRPRCRSRRAERSSRSTRCTPQTGSSSCSRTREPAVVVARAGRPSSGRRRRRRASSRSGTSSSGVDASRCRRQPRGDDLAYVIYTSGSTGRPEGRDDHEREPRQRVLRLRRGVPADRRHHEPPADGELLVRRLHGRLHPLAALAARSSCCARSRSSWIRRGCTR